MKLITKIFFLSSLVVYQAVAQGSFEVSQYNVVWTKQSANSSESMPCGGGDIGLNVWTEKDEILFYLSRSGAFDENNVFPKFGRVRLRITPNLFQKATFKQELKLNESYVEISSAKNKKKVLVKIWVDVFKPVVHIETESDEKLKVEAWYENWRDKDLTWTQPGQRAAEVGLPVGLVLHMGADVQVVLRQAAEVGHAGDVRALAGGQLHRQLLDDGLVGNDVQDDLGTGVRGLELLGQLGGDVALMPSW